MNNRLKLLSKFKTSNAFVNASFVYIIANGIGQGTTLLANIFFTRYMSQNDYGMYSNYYSYVAMLGPFVGMNLYNGLANAYLDYKNEIHKFRSSVMMLSLFGLAFMSMVFLLLKATIGFSMPYICILIILAHAYGFFLVNYYIVSMNMENRYIAKGVFLCIPNILQVLLAIIAVFLCNTYISRAMGSMVGILMCGLAAAILVVKTERPTVNTMYWKYALRISLPAIIGSVSAMLMQQCDKVMITSLYNAEATAVYALIYNIGYILYAVQQATDGVWQVWLYNTLDKGRYRNIPGIQKWYMYVMLVLVTGLYMLAPEIIKILSPRNYWCFEYVVPFIIGSYLMLMYSLHMTVAQYKKKTGVVSAIVFLAALINVVLNYILIPKLGGIGAAYTSVVSYLFIFVVSGIYLVKRREYYFCLKYFAVFGTCAILMGILFYVVRNEMIVRYTVFGIILLLEGLYTLNRRDEIRHLFSGKIKANE